jgi:hypothetical protein
MQHTGGGRLRRALLLSIVLGALLAAHAAGLTFTAQDRATAPNGTVIVPIVVADAQDLGGVELVATYDPAVLRFESVTPGVLAGRARVSANETGPGRIAIAVASPGSLTGTGPVLALTFTAVGPAGARSAVGLEAVRAVTIDGDPVPARVANGPVSVGGGARTPLSPFGAVGALAIAAASLRGADRRRSRQEPPPQERA